MTRRKLLIGLVSTGAFTAGFGATVIPATAQLRTISVTLLTGQTVTVKVDAPAGTPVDQLDLPVDGPIKSATEITPAAQGSTAQVAPVAPTETAATQTSTAPTSTAQTSTAQTEAPPTTPPAETGTSAEPPAAEPAPTTSAPEPLPAAPGTTATTPGATPSETPTVIGDDRKGPKASKGGQRKQKTTGSKMREEGDGTFGDVPGTGPKTQADRERQAETGALRTTDGAPTLANPGFTEALPGAAPIGVPNFFIDKFRIPPFLLPIYQAAGIEYGIRWEILAAINEIETDYGRNLNVSSAGALGWMQFMPATWKSYGTDANQDGKKDPYNPVDAIFASARYLKAAGADTDIRKAIFAYNHADWYVDSVLMRARLIGGMPTDLIGSLTGLTQGRFPVDGRAVYADDLSEREYAKRIARGHNAAVPVESNSSRNSINIFAKPGTPAVATQDVRVTKIGQNKRLGRFIKVRDVYGNTYTYGHLGAVADAYATPKAAVVSAAQVRRELKLRKDPKPTSAASAGSNRRAAATAKSAPAPARNPQPKPAAPTAETAAGPQVTKVRVFANPARPEAFRNGGKGQLDGGSVSATPSTHEPARDAVVYRPGDVAAYAKVLGLKPSQVTIRRMRVGAKLAAGTVVGQIGEAAAGKAPHLGFEIRPAGEGAPRIDPKPILDGWKLLESTAIYRAAGKNPFFGPDAKNPTIGQILLMSKESLMRSVLSNPQIKIYECGRRDIRGGVIDRRVLATLEFLAASGLRPTVTSLNCGHGFYTAGGNVSEHSTGSALDIGAINGIPILGHQGAGSVTDMTIRRLLTLQGTMKPHQIISLMTFDGADNTLSLPDHADHIHVGFRPEFDPNSKRGKKVSQVLKPNQWIKLIDRIGKIDNPEVLESPSKYALDAKPRTRAHSEGR